MKSRWRNGWAAVALGAMLAAAACAQEGSVAAPGAGLTAEELSAAPSNAVPINPGQIVREIDDPSTGDRWLLLRNDGTPGGPDRLVLVGSDRNRLGGDAASGTAATVQAPYRAVEAQARILPVIQDGDRLIVVEHTAVVDAVLEARALGTAARGVALNVRLSIGGRVMRAVATGPGRAELEPEYGVEP